MEITGKELETKKVTLHCMCIIIINSMEKADPQAAQYLTAPTMRPSERRDAIQGRQAVVAQ